MQRHLIDNIYHFQQIKLQSDGNIGISVRYTKSSILKVAEKKTKMRDTLEQR